MFLNPIIELLKLVALVAAMTIPFTYNPQPGHYSSIENFYYYLNFIGGSACHFLLAIDTLPQCVTFILYRLTLQRNLYQLLLDF